MTTKLIPFHHIFFSFFNDIQAKKYTLNSCYLVILTKYKFFFIHMYLPGNFFFNNKFVLAANLA